MATLERAIAIAAAAHEGQKDKAGASYILHPLRLMMRMRSEEAMMAAVLHDVVEDGQDKGWTMDRLRREGFAEEVLQAVGCLTKKDGETYDEFIERVRGSQIAVEVKVADLEDNMDVKRIGALAEKDVERIGKYHRAWVKLTGRPNV